ncbi:hypothetical protein N658DRAFT_306613 [Parathielavia hyrcaniae]|uniref:Uncharacterized protein n=1 Tax=Parathielavia hyrcaniae TaxID=113614 RepID=A0AAN6Q460_9PEZI|nr:hypothetical protein N658DRAFT_306613 [Parathielavia hyrcaniae]
MQQDYHQDGGTALSIFVTIIFRSPSPTEYAVFSVVLYPQFQKFIAYMGVGWERVVP